MSSQAKELVEERDKGLVPAQAKQAKVETAPQPQRPAEPLLHQVRSLPDIELVIRQPHDTVCTVQCKLRLLLLFESLRGFIGHGKENRPKLLSLCRPLEEETPQLWQVCCETGTIQPFPWARLPTPWPLTRPCATLSDATWLPRLSGGTGQRQECQAD